MNDTQVPIMAWQEVLDKLTTQLKNKIILDKDTNKTIDLLYKDDSIRSFLLKWMNKVLERNKEVKCELKAKEYRLLGNEKFMSGDDIGSLELYSKSVCNAPCLSEEFSLALANRSAALFRLQRYTECLEDINKAIFYGYPEKLKYKLLLRKGKTLLVLKRCKEAVDVLKEAQDQITSGVKGFIQNDIQEALSAAVSNCNLKEKKTDISIEYLLPKLRNGESQELKYASATLQMKESEEKGRYIVTNTDIEEGDVLFVEKPYAFVTLPGQADLMCHHCCVNLFAPVSCSHCISAVYCSQQCSREAWKTYHQWECGSLELFHSLGIAHLGLRVALVSISKEEDGRYFQVKSLMTHMDDMLPEDFLQYALTALLLSLYLENKTKFFVTKNIVFNDICLKIMDHICQLICNGHAITKLNSRLPNSTYSKCELIDNCQEWAATAIFPSASMMNHSCDPNIINSFCNEYLIVRAARDIPKGTEVFNCYGPCFRRMSTVERKEVLKKQYFFDCSCQPCQKDGTDDFLARFTAFLCTECEGPLLPIDLNHGICKDCGENKQILKLLEQKTATLQTYDEGLEKLQKGEINDALDTFNKCVKEFTKYLYKHNIKLRESRNNLAKCYALLRQWGNSGKYLIATIPAIEEQFGSNSVEIANELQNLTDILIAELEEISPENEIYKEKIDSCSFYINKALHIFDLNYGKWNDGYKEIIRKHALLLDKMESKEYKRYKN